VIVVVEINSSMGYSWQWNRVCAVACGDDVSSVRDFSISGNVAFIDEKGEVVTGPALGSGVHAHFFCSSKSVSAFGRIARKARYLVSKR